MTQQESTPSLLKRIECAYVPVSNVEASAGWYERVLGLKLRSPVKPGRGAIMMMGSGQWLFLLPSPQMIPLTFETTGWAAGSEPFEMFPLCFETDNIYALYDAVQSSGCWMETAIRDEGGCGLQLDFKDMDGNKFQAWQQPVRKGGS